VSPVCLPAPVPPPGKTATEQAKNAKLPFSFFQPFLLPSLPETRTRFCFSQNPGRPGQRVTPSLASAFCKKGKPFAVCAVSALDALKNPTSFRPAAAPCTRIVSHPYCILAQQKPHPIGYRKRAPHIKPSDPHLPGLGRGWIKVRTWTMKPKRRKRPRRQLRVWHNCIAVHRNAQECPVLCCARQQPCFALSPTHRTLGHFYLCGKSSEPTDVQGEQV
jgi:hypothetical protein